MVLAAPVLQRPGLTRLPGRLAMGPAAPDGQQRLKAVASGYHLPYRRRRSEHLDELGNYLIRILVALAEADWREFRIVRFEGNAGMPPAFAIAGFGALVSLDGVAVAGLRVRGIPKLNENSTPLARPGYG